MQVEVFSSRPQASTKPANHVMSTQEVSGGRQASSDLPKIGGFFERRVPTPHEQEITKEMMEASNADLHERRAAELAGRSITT